MASRKQAYLSKIDHNHPITRESDAPFLHHTKKALLLSLAEQGVLNPRQLAAAEERLNAQPMKKS